MVSKQKVDKAQPMTNSNLQKRSFNLPLIFHSNMTFQP